MLPVKYRKPPPCDDLLLTSTRTNCAESREHLRHLQRMQILSAATIASSLQTLAQCWAALAKAEKIKSELLPGIDPGASRPTLRNITGSGTSQGAGG